MKIDTDSEITHFVKDEIIDHENFKDEMLIDWQLENKTTGDHSFYQSLERKVNFQNLNFLCDLCNEKISDKKTLQSHCIGHLKAFWDSQKRSRASQSYASLIKIHKYGCA